MSQEQSRTALRFALGVGAAYAVCGVLWILLSDQLVLHLTETADGIASAQSYKGVGFVAVTAVALVLIVRGGYWRLLKTKERAIAGELRVQGLFQLHPEPMWVYDTDTLKFLAVNEAAIQHYGYAEAEFLSMSLEDISTADELLRLKAPVDEAQSRSRVTGILHHRKKNGEAIVVNVTSHEVPFQTHRARLALAQDVTQDAISRNAVERQEKQFRQLHDSLQEALWLYSADDGRVLYVSTAFETVYGRTSEELVRDPGLWSKVIYKEDRAVALQALSDLREFGRSKREYRIERPDGELRWVCDRRRNIVGSDGAVLMVGGIVEDVTDSKQTTLALQQLNDELEARVSSRTEELQFVNRELDAFTMTAAHDLRTPLHAIAGFAEILRFQYKDELGVEGDAMAAHIQTAALSMAKLVRDLLALSRVTTHTLHRTPTDVEGIAVSIVRTLMSDEPGRQVAIGIDKMEPVQADEGLVRSLMTNLLDNAWKYTGKRLDASIEVGCTATEGKNVFFVRDNGAGFDMGKAVELFKPFQRFHSSSEFAGTGVGLATCQRIVRRHGGSIWVASACGAGTTVYFTLTPSIDTSLPASLSRDSNFAQLA